ncbi:U3 small nucleolar RNA-associated protein 18 homolog isoform X2 [Thalassophryne amazonica]|uniref:U3 small nucleolar RNA-associated protein 18 homolog isoform X2 n=1 Tax=Thalassophryne amazonica TaxID=390379 RepID=UPI00147163EE|nr:U3 small nucleolar RNA-associated protein 18 homolog isoform X2 [Thalassophryne amazonica]
MNLLLEEEEVKRRNEEEQRRRNVQNLSVLGQEDDSVKLLEELLFEPEDELLDRLVQDDKQAATLLADDDDFSESQTEDDTHLQLQPTRKAAWVDDDDELEEDVDMKHRFRRDLVRGEAESTMSKQRLQSRMREEFQKSMGGAPLWAESKVTKKRKKADEDDDTDDEDDLLRKTGNFVTSSESLPAGILRMKKCLHANSARPSDAGLSTVQFHPSAQVVMTAGLDQSISLFQVDGKTNPKIQSIHLDRFPVHKARFTADGQALVATGLRNKMFYVYDMMEGHVVPVHAVRGLKEDRVKEFSICPEGGTLLLTGTNGYLHVLTLKTKEVINSMKINGNVGGVAVSRDGSRVFASSEEGEVYVWDLRSSRCVNKFIDDGCVKATSIATSPDGQYLACGSQSGVVNIYHQEACLNSASPKPLKAVMNLVTSVTSLTFNPSSEMLAVASRLEDDAVRLVHLPSLTVFSNFPVTRKKIIYRATCLDFSPHSGFFSLANNKGHAPLFRLLHYHDF